MIKYNLPLTACCWSVTRGLHSAE